MAKQKRAYKKKKGGKKKNKAGVNKYVFSSTKKIGGIPARSYGKICDVRIGTVTSGTAVFVVENVFPMNTPVNIDPPLLAEMRALYDEYRVVGSKMEITLVPNKDFSASGKGAYFYLMPQTVATTAAQPVATLVTGAEYLDKLATKKLFTKNLANSGSLFLKGYRSMKKMFTPELFLESWTATTTDFSQQPHWQFGVFNFDHSIFANDELQADFRLCQTYYLQFRKPKQLILALE